jgi:DNA-binding HxlR family transcriptional regulator
MLRPTDIEPKNGCIASAMLIIGNKWTALLIRDLFTGSKRFHELEKSITGINPRTLSQRLDDLEAHGLITKQSFAEVDAKIDDAIGGDRWEPTKAAKLFADIAKNFEGASN